MNWFLNRAALVFLTGLCIGCEAHRTAYRPLPKTLSAAVWRTHDGQGRLIHTSGAPELKLLPELKNKADLGIAASGGGSRAAVATLGQFRGLEQMGLLGRARYISSVSGGTWFCAPYIFGGPGLLPAREKPNGNGQKRSSSQRDFDRTFMGDFKSPALLTPARLKEEPEDSFIRAVTHIDMRVSDIFDGFGTEAFSRIVAASFLAPFGLDQANKSFTWSPRWFDEHIARHNNSALTRDDFFFVTPGRPFLIMNESLVFTRRASFFDRIGFSLLGSLWPARVPDWKAWWPVESTPLYTGMRPVAVDGTKSCDGQSRRTAGGGAVDSFAYGSRFAKWSDASRGRADVKPQCQSRQLPPSMFSLSDAVANSGAAPAAALGEIAYAFGLEAKHWHWPAYADDPSRGEKRRPHVDGGVCDNSGVISLLARGSSRIISLNNAIHRLPRNGGRGAIAPADLPTDVTALFGKLGSTTILNIAGQPAANSVLDINLSDGRNALDDLASEFSARNVTGRPLVVCREYITVKNDRYDIPGGQRVRICWVFLAFARVDDGLAVAQGGTILDRWIRNLPPESRVMFTEKRSIRRNDLEHFPVYNIIKENRKPQQLSPVQANALAQFTAFCVAEAAPEIRRALGL